MLVVDPPRPVAAGTRDGLLVVSNGEVVLANRALSRLLGVPAGALVGGPPPDWNAGPLTQVELEHVRRHPTIGAALAAHVLDDEQAAWLLHHHERPDGSGYPSGLTAALIPDGARIIAIAYAFDAMTSARGYQPIRTTDEALAEIERDIPGAEALLRGALSWWSSR